MMTFTGQCIDTFHTESRMEWEQHFELDHSGAPLPGCEPWQGETFSAPTKLLPHPGRTRLKVGPLTFRERSWLGCWVETPTSETGQVWSLGERNTDLFVAVSTPTGNELRRYDYSDLKVLDDGR